MISGFFDSRGRFPHVLVRVHIPGVSEPRVVPFLIDTGSSTTVVHARDAVRRLQLRAADLDPRSWPERQVQASGGVGGLAFYRAMDASYDFAHEGGAIETISASVELGAVDTSSLPSLLGWDVLQHFRLDLNARRGSVALLAT